MDLRALSEFTCVYIFTHMHINTHMLSYLPELKKGFLVHIHEFKECCCLEISAPNSPTACDQEFATKSQKKKKWSVTQWAQYPQPTSHSHSLPGTRSQFSALQTQHEDNRSQLQETKLHFWRRFRLQGQMSLACPLTLDQPQETEEKLGVTMLKTLEGFYTGECGVRIYRS